jgi:hypothetical protein
MSILTAIDWFAIHADQPGQLEIAAEAGVRVREYAPVSFTPHERDALPFFHEWYNALTPKARYRFSAKVRYAQAKAMMEIRAE